MRRCQHDVYLDIEVMTCHSSLVLPSSSSATCSAWELSLGRDIWNFFWLQVAAGLPVLGHKWCMPTNYKVTPSPLLSITTITTYLPCFFSYTYIFQEFNGCRFCVFKVLNAIHCSLILKLPANYLKLLTSQTRSLGIIVN